MQASVFCALGVLVAAGGPAWLRWAGGVLSVAALIAFALSRTVGLFGFTEHGWHPAPQAALSVAAEALTGGPDCWCWRDRFNLFATATRACTGPAHPPLVSNTAMPLRSGPSVDACSRNGLGRTSTSLPAQCNPLLSPRPAPGRVRRNLFWPQVGR